MAPISEIAIEPLDPRHADGVVALFEGADVPCYCQYFSFSGDNRDWQMRCAGDRQKNEAALREQLRQQALRGFVALERNRVIGWLRLDAPQALAKRYEGRLYRALPCFDGPRETVLSVVCFLVDVEHRRAGVAGQLLDAALSWARGAGVSCLEAFPRGALDVTDEEQWTGPLPLYESRGFRLIHEFSPYPVLRFDFDSQPRS